MTVDELIEKLAMFKGQFVLQANGMIRHRRTNLCVICHYCYITTGMLESNDSVYVAAEKLDMSDGDRDEIVAASDGSERFELTFERLKAVLGIRS